MTKEDLKNYIRIEGELKYLCNRWAEEHLEDWQYYSGFDVKNDHVVINYTFNDYWSNTETCTEWDSVKVSIDELINQ